MRFSLPAIALRRPITVIMLVISVLGLGLIAGMRIPLEFLPEMEFPFIICWIPYPGATPEQVENEIAIPAEGEFRTLANLRRIVTTSDTNGCIVRMRFDWDADMNTAMAEVRDRMERLKLQLPSEIERLWLRRWSSESIEILAFSLFREGDDEALSHLVRDQIEPKLMRLDGVAEVTVWAPALIGIIDYIIVQ